MAHEHTVGTLRYASRAMKIQNSLALTKVSAEEELALLRGMVAQLQVGRCYAVRYFCGMLYDLPRKD